MKKMERMKRAGLTLIMAAAICGLTACGGNRQEAEREDAEQITEQHVTSKEETEQQTEAEQNPEAETTAMETETDNEADEEIAEKPAAVTESEEFTPVAGLSENYADLENRCFAYKGQIFTLGKSTLQDLIDGGIPFDENDLNNIGNSVNSNYETSRYNAEINHYVNMQFTFMNTTQENISESECLLCNVRWCPLYVPQPDYEESLNEEIRNSINDSKNYVCFSFPLTLTKEQLLENNDAATEIDEYNNVRYRIDSEVYMGDSGYNFEFNKKTNQLEDVSISWLP